MSEEQPPKVLDEFDLMLIRELEIDARRSSIELAEKLGMSHTTIRRRLQNLLDEGIISIVTITHPRAMGYLTLVLLAVNTRPGKVEDVAGRLASFDCVQMVTAIAGCYDLVATIVIKDLEDLIGLISGDVGSIEEITNMETMVILKVFKNDSSYLGASECIMNRTLTKDHLDELEIALIRELELEPRETISQLAVKLGTNRANVSRRLHSLLEGGVIRIMSVPNPSALGYTIVAMLQLKIDTTRLEEIVEKLSGYSNVTQIIMTTGRFELGVAVVFRGNNEAYDFVKNKVGNIPGVLRYEMFINMKTYKYSFRVPPLSPPAIL